VSERSGLDPPEEGRAPVPEEVRVDGRRAFEGKLLDLEVDRVRLSDGREVLREVVRHPGAAAILAWLPAEGPEPEERVLLLRQFRYPVGEALWEIPAGTLEEGETARSCAARELEEETGFRASELAALGTIRTSPGFTDERVHLFEARGLEEGAPRPDADERFERTAVSRREAVRMVRRGEITDAKTVCALLLAVGGQRFGGAGRL